MPKLRRLTHVMRIRGVDVYVHWSVLLIAGVILLGAFRAQKPRAKDDISIAASG